MNYRIAGITLTALWSVLTCSTSGNARNQYCEQEAQAAEPLVLEMPTLVPDLCILLAQQVLAPCHSSSRPRPSAYYEPIPCRPTIRLTRREAATEPVLN
jgi:hypothetical protein